MKKEKIIEGEPIEENYQEEKKDNSFKKFWNKTKKGFNDLIQDSKIENTFNNQNTEYTIYQKDELLSTTVFGYLDTDKIIIYGNKEFQINSVIVDENSKKPYYIKKISNTTIDIKIDDTIYTKPGTILETDEQVIEVKVIKAGKKYYLYKENNEK